MHQTKKTVFVVITKSNFGGAQRYVFDLVRSLKHDYAVTVVFGGSGLLATKLKQEQVETISIPTLIRDVDIWNDIQTFFFLRRLLRQRKPDIVHLNSSKMGILGSLAARSVGGMKTLFTAHAWAFNEQRNIFQKILLYCFHALTVICAHHTIAVSHAVQKQMSHLPFLRRKITTIHLGIESLSFLQREKAREVLGIPQEAFCIGTIAELHPIKGLQDAISAIGKLHGDTTYAIMGEGEYRKVLARLGGEKMGSNNFILTGYKENASAYLHAFDVFLLPSHSEALGYVLLEAGCARVPVVATRVGGIPEIIHHEHSGRLVDPKNIQQITDALSYVREHPKDALMYSENLYQYVTGEYSLQKMIDSTKGLYETQ